MAEQIWQNCKLWLAGYDLSGDMNALALDYGAELQDNTTFDDDTRSRLGGLKTVTVQHEGLWNGGDDQVDEVLFSRLGLIDEVMSISPQAGAEGEIGYSFQSALSEYAPGATVGEILAFSVSGEASSGPLVRGTIVHNAARTANGQGSAFQLGNVAAGQKLYAALHVVAASGTTPTLVVKVQSDITSGMTGPPTDRITFAQASAIGAQWATPVAGAITDDWWRVDYAIGGTGPSFTFVVIIGIQ